MVDWQAVRTVLLDMDGTLLDLHYDNHFWLEHVPRRYAERHALPLDEARALLHERTRAVEGTMAWYCVDYWSEQLGLDIARLKQEVEHLIAVHPDVVEFLAAVRGSGRRAVLVTNAHGKSLALKMRRTRLGGHLDGVVCAHDLGLPKEESGFWSRLQAREPFDPEATLLVDDSLPVLRSAARHGIAQLLAVRRPDSRRPPREVTEFPAIDGFAELLPLSGPSA
ncbi:MAG: GMP/IMP nucleotidase [Gammaproteobacteria bacterium]|nr:GMP/IMP nucleotidase [Gammaproteobacteria bacterium]